MAGGKVDLLICWKLLINSSASKIILRQERSDKAVSEEFYFIKEFVKYWPKQSLDANILFLTNDKKKSVARYRRKSETSASARRETGITQPLPFLLGIR